MKVFDRYLDQTVNLPKVITPGRFKLLKNDCLNEDIKLSIGDLIFSDGRSHCNIGAVEVSFLNVGQTENEVAKQDLLAPALASIAQIIRDGNEKGLSPLLPAETGELAELADIEKSLLKVMVHLREIDRRPRFSMHYQDEISPVSRAKRIATAAIVHLASHSEDWHRRTLSAVKPKRILAQFSEDDWSIYENQVFARLLDRLDIYLKRRIADLIQLKETYQDALNLGESPDIYHRLCNSLCQLWGDALSVKDTSRLLDTTSDSIQTIRDLAKNVSVLRQGELYKRVPRKAHISEQLRDTNILQHDLHYSHLRNLWLMYQKRSSAMQKSPLEIFQQNRSLFDDYVVYLGMLIRRALEGLKLLQSYGVNPSASFIFGGDSVQLRQERDEWKLEYRGKTLTIVPAIFPDLETNNIANLPANWVPVFLFPSTSEFKELSAITENNFIVNPLEFYGLERISMLVETFLWKHILIEYGNPILKLPSNAITWLQSKGFGNGNSDKFVILKPLPKNSISELENWLKSATVNNDTKEVILRRVYDLTTLSSCRSCGDECHFVPRNDGFKVSCVACSLEWVLFRRGGKHHASFRPNGDLNGSFKTHGSWRMEFEV